MKPTKPRGFTLVELMVTIVIVTILASLIFIFAKRGIQAAKAAKCVSNMRQVQTGVMSVVENGVRTSYNPPGTFPPYAGQQQGPWNQFSWWDLVGEQMGMAESIGGKYIWKIHPKETVFQNPLSKYSLGGEGAEWKPFHGNPDASGGSFSQNNLIGDWVASHTAPGAIKDRVKRVSEVPYPANTILFGETDDKVAESRQPTVAFWGTGNAPQGNHKESAHCMFVDGHVELILNKRLKNNDWLNHYRQLRPPQKDMAKPE